ncbi:MAG: efflux RND transporter permease subunit [Candidatus Hydrogenedentes bacterium]|nr:efflux RND transporter permease subunit [Candidatus Hydrogenedentota bacterium]
MGWIIQASLRMRVLVVALALTLMVMGASSMRSTKLDVFPEFAPPHVEIQTEAPGLSTEEVESLISVPLENALNSTPHIATIRSKSVLGLSSVVLYFDESIDLDAARQQVQERVTLAASRLPVSARTPVILPALSSTSRVLKIGVSSKTYSQMDLSEIAKWTIRPRLLAVPGVANVAIWGQRDRQLQVLVDSRRLAVHDVLLDEIVSAARGAVASDSGGYIDTPNQRLAVRHVSSIQEPDDLAQAIVKTVNGTPLRIGDVADVQAGSPLPIGDAIINGGPGLLLIVEMYPWGNTLDVTRGVESALHDLAPGLEGIEVDSTIFRPATFIERSLRNLMHALLAGCVLVIVVLVAFLMDWRAAFISLLAIPLSLIAAIVVMRAMGQTVNTMVIAGLAIALGSLVDDAIIDVENIVRRLRLNRESATPKSTFRVVLDASLEVRSAIVYATIIVILVFLPVFFLDGLPGSFFRPLAQAYVLSTLASLVVAITLTPALAYMLLPRANFSKREPAFAMMLKRRYRNWMARAINRPKWAYGILGASLGITAIIIPMLGQGFLPKFQETDFLMHWVEKPGISVDAMRRITIRASDELLTIPGVRNFGAHIGRAEVADEVVGPNFTELWISIDPDADYQGTVDKVQEAVNGYPGLHRDLLTYLSERIKEVLTGASASIVVRIFGPELDRLLNSAKDVAGAMQGIPGVMDLKVESQVLVPQITVRMKPEAGPLYGVTEEDIRKAERTFVSGLKVGEIYSDQRITDVLVWGTEESRADLAALRSLLIETKAGVRVPLEEVATIEIVPTPNMIRREGASRRIDVTCNVEGRDLGSVAQEIEEKVRGLSFEQGYFPQFLGEFEARQSARNRLIGLTLVSLLGILVLLQSDFQSLRLVFMVFLSLPFALVGGVFGSLVGGGVLSLGSLVGFVAVFGIAARNGIMLISHCRHLEVEEGQKFGKNLVLRGAEERLSPILMTSLATGLALLPIALGGNKPGYEIEFPMALVILGGLFSSTMLNLFLLPTIYLHVGRGVNLDHDNAT